MIRVENKNKAEIDQVMKDEFELPAAQKLATYDEQGLADEWNTKYGNSDEGNERESRNPVVRFGKFLQHFTMKKLVLSYLIAYYVVNIVVVRIMCAKDPAKYQSISRTARQLMIDVATNASDVCQTKSNLTEKLSAKNYGYRWCSKYDKFVGDLSVAEDDFIRLLTYLVGFFVTFTLRRWWQQVISVPKIDTACLALEGSIWCNPSKNQDDVYVKEGVSITQFKQTVVRYYLLSWTMCLSMFSPSLRKELRGPKDFSRHRLMNYDEYQRLKLTNSDTKDGWKKKWNIPLMWVNAMLNNLETVSATLDDVKVKAMKENHKATTDFHKRLRKLIEANNNHLPKLFLSAIEWGLRVWLIVGILAAQNSYSGERGLWIPLALLFNFPLVHLVELVVVFSWIHEASLLISPFGLRRYI